MGLPSSNGFNELQLAILDERKEYARQNALLTVGDRVKTTLDELAARHASIEQQRSDRRRARLHKFRLATRDARDHRHSKAQQARVAHDSASITALIDAATPALEPEVPPKQAGKAGAAGAPGGGPAGKDGKGKDGKQVPWEQSLRQGGADGNKKPAAGLRQSINNSGAAGVQRVEETPQVEEDPATALKTQEAADELEDALKTQEAVEELECRRRCAGGCCRRRCSSMSPGSASPSRTCSVEGCLTVGVWDCRRSWLPLPQPAPPS